MGLCHRQQTLDSAPVVFHLFTDVRRCERGANGLFIPSKDTLEAALVVKGNGNALWVLTTLSPLEQIVDLGKGDLRRQQRESEGILDKLIQPSTGFDPVHQIEVREGTMHVQVLVLYRRGRIRLKEKPSRVISPRNSLTITRSLMNTFTLTKIRSLMYNTGLRTRGHAHAQWSSPVCPLGANPWAFP
eukprot:gene18769-biopygen5631